MGQVQRDSGNVWDLRVAPGPQADDAIICGVGPGCVFNELFCSATTSQCTKPALVGASCDSCLMASSCDKDPPCAMGSFCDSSSTSTCVASKSLGAPCALGVNAQCADGYCKAGTCSPWVAPGAECDPDWGGCLGYCMNGTCKAPDADQCKELGWNAG